MADWISKEDRALIDAAVAAGRVKRVKMGTTSAVVFSRWGVKKRPQWSVDIDRQIVAMLKDGKPLPRIAEELGIVKQEVYSRYHRIKQRGEIDGQHSKV